MPFPAYLILDINKPIKVTSSIQEPPMGSNKNFMDSNKVTKSNDFTIAELLKNNETKNILDTFQIKNTEDDKLKTIKTNQKIMEKERKKKVRAEKKNKKN